VLVGAAMPAPGWHHVVYTFDGTTHHMFIDGLDKGLGTTDGDTGAVGQSHLGAFGSEHFAGDMDDVRIYNRALSPAEITALHDGQE
jgi:hypothetical protein